MHRLAGSYMIFTSSEWYMELGHQLRVQYLEVRHRAVLKLGMEYLVVVLVAWSPRNSSLTREGSWSGKPSATIALLSPLLVGKIRLHMENDGSV